MTEQFRTVPIGERQYVVIAVDPEARTARWVAPEPGKTLYKSRQAAAWHRKQPETENDMITLSSYIGTQGALWQRVCLVFEGLGYVAPTPDTNSSGAYVSNVENQYKGYFNLEEIIAIIEFAKINTVEQLQRDKERGWIDREAVFNER